MPAPGRLAMGSGDTRPRRTVRSLLRPSNPLTISQAPPTTKMARMPTPAARIPAPAHPGHVVCRLRAWSHLPSWRDAHSLWRYRGHVDDGHVRAGASPPRFHRCICLRLRPLQRVRLPRRNLPIRRRRGRLGTDRTPALPDPRPRRGDAARLRAPPPSVSLGPRTPVAHPAAALEWDTMT